MDDGLLHVLDGLAANPAAPPDVLFRLAAVPRAAKEMAWRQSDLPDTVVERLLATGDSTVALALDSPRQSEATRQRIADHPDAGIRNARSRFVEHQIRVGNRVMPDDLAAYAGPGGLAGLARHEDPVLRAAVAGTWAAMPVAVRRELLADPDPRVRKAAAGFPHPPAPADLHAVLLADETTRVEVASYAALTAEAVRECLAGDEELRGAVALNPALPPASRDRLEQDPSQYVRSRVLLRQDLPEDRRRRLHAALLTEPEDVDTEVPFAMALLHHERPSWLPSRPLAERVAHLDSPIPCFRRYAATSADLPADVVRRLHAHEDVQVRHIVALRADTPGEVLERLVAEHGEGFRHRGHTEHPNFPPEAFVRLATAENPSRRALAAKGPDLPADVIAVLARDTEAVVRAAAARHSRIPVRVLETLLTDNDQKVIEAAGTNPALPVDRMRALLDRAGL
ncbi:hypothetical protein AB0L41_42140 [Amycolatopsis mediterranei]|uniref:hypothetical protein n=1 Tax=Amycolatopsis mediterranei TaxID=33910 RepID=UPI0034255048